MNATTRATFDELRDGFAKANPGRDPLTPPAQGLYDPSKEHDSCGVGFVADMKNRKSHDILEMHIFIYHAMAHDQMPFQPFRKSRRSAAVAFDHLLQPTPAK